MMHHKRPASESPEAPAWAPIRLRLPAAASALAPLLLAVLSALLAFAAAPPLAWRPLGWVALAPLFLAVLRAPRHRTAADRVSQVAWLVEWLGVGWVFGLVYYGLEFAWSHHTLVRLGGMGLPHFLGAYALLVGFLALGPGVVVSLACLAGRVLPRGRGLATLSVLPLLWSGMETLWSVFPFGGVGWATLAVSQPHTWAARLLVPAGGPFALTGLMVGVNVLWAALAARMLDAAHAPPRRPGPLRFAPPALLVLGTLAAALTAPLQIAPPGGDTLPALLVQGDRTVAQLDAERETPVTARYYLARTLTALAASSDRNRTPRERSDPRGLVIWPESAIGPGVSPVKSMLSLGEFARLFERDILLGRTVSVRGRDRNALYWVRGDVFATARYHKRQLVPFGEYVPAGFHWLFPRKITRGDEDYLPGRGPPVLGRPDARPHASVPPPFLLGTALCFESTLPHHFRDAVLAGAAALVVVANDAWLPPWAVQRHVALTALNALAVGRDAAFVANGGPAALLRGGRAVMQAAPGGAPLEVALRLSAGQTPWVRFGNAPVLGLLLLPALAALLPMRRPRRDD